MRRYVFMDKVISIILFLFIMAMPCEAVEIEFSRGMIDVQDGDTISKNMFIKGTIEGLNNVTFIGVHFTRLNPHTKVFINCANLTFIDCNLMNVELQSDFTVKGCLIIHKRKYNMIGVDYEELEYKDGKTKTFRIDNIGEETESKTLTNTKDTDNAKKINVKYVNPNTGIVAPIGISVIK